MGNERLTAKQRRLVRELDLIVQRVGLNYQDVLRMKRKVRTTVLEVAIRRLVRGEVVERYTLIDEFMANVMAQYFFPKRDFIRAWRTQRFRRFNFFVLERLSLMHKFAFVKDLYDVPRGIAANVDALNAVRNAMAHAFFPENLRAYVTKGKPGPSRPVPVTYKGIDIFTAAGVSRFREDSEALFDYLHGARRRKRAKFPKGPSAPTAPSDADP